MWSVQPQPYLLFFIYQQAQQIEVCYNMKMVLTAATFSRIFSITYMGYWRTFFRRKIEFLEAKVYFIFIFIFSSLPQRVVLIKFSRFSIWKLWIKIVVLLYFVWHPPDYCVFKYGTSVSVGKKNAFEDLQLRRENISFKFLSVFSGEIIFQACLNDLLVL